jgi:2'-5' RNA ligase
MKVCGDNCSWIGIGVDVERGKLNDECVAMNAMLKTQYGSSIDFSGKDVPHLNLYDLSVPTENISTIEKNLEKIAGETKPISIEIESVGYFPFGIFFLKLKMNDALSDFHKKIVDAIVPFKSDCVDKDYAAPYRNYTPRQSELLEQYGNPFVLDCFEPHITIGHIRNKNVDFDMIKDELEKLLKTKAWTADNLHIATNGRQTVKRFALG